MELKEFVKKQARERNISLADIQQRLGLNSYNSFLRTLANADNLKLRQLRTIADMLGCTMDELSAGEINEKPSGHVCPHCGHELTIRVG